MLAASNTLVLSGNYTFDDTNHNGISDAWEQYYFGKISTSRTQYTDTDGDGMTDYAEFIAVTNPANATSKLAFFPGSPDKRRRPTPMGRNPRPTLPNRNLDKP